MILELLEYLLTPCPPAARSMGFPASTIQVRTRYRRCKRVWAPHLQNTRNIILEAASRCPNRRKVAVLGSGLLYDIPLRELSLAFHEVLLVDIVHPWSSRMAAGRFRNVKLITADVTEAMEPLLQIIRTPGAPLPTSHPVRFLHDTELDLTVSVNTLSQIPHLPGEYLDVRLDEATIDAFLKHLIEAHLDYLRRLPGHTALITDRAVRRTTRSNGHVEEWDALHGVRLPSADYTWEWLLAPSPEVARGIDLSTIVAAYVDWKKA